MPRWLVKRVCVGEGGGYLEEVASETVHSGQEVALPSVGPSIGGPSRTEGRRTATSLSAQLRHPTPALGRHCTWSFQTQTRASQWAPGCSGLRTGSESHHWLPWVSSFQMTGGGTSCFHTCVRRLPQDIHIPLVLFLWRSLIQSCSYELHFMNEATKSPTDYNPKAGKKEGHVQTQAAWLRPSSEGRHALIKSTSVAHGAQVCSHVKDPCVLRSGLPKIT